MTEFLVAVLSQQEPHNDVGHYVFLFLMTPFTSGTLHELNMYIIFRWLLQDLVVSHKQVCEVCDRAVMV